ncbi:MFS transporter [Streptomyces sp. SHP 1-2]|uniref:MFS transporter n=1 Tax=Streptomyces sp. SHP 1-2 TaxID=2769489 RepID=UPI0022370701|nr:MFS transporter [Streptomyces sp. SHP 1-2]MCW5250824.1 MFS transporter [Streptomyces sp. SHP 1-2]
MERPASTAPPSRRGAGQRDVRLLWWANAADGIGSQATGAVLPLLLLHLGHPPRTVGLIAGVSTAVGLLLAPLVAVPADRGARKRVMLAASVLAALAMGGLGLALSLGSPPIALILTAVLAERVATTSFDAAARGTVALLCPGPEQGRVVSRLAAADQGSLIVGPALGGLLYQLSRALPFAADALSYVIGALCVRAMRSDLTAPGPDRADPAAPRPADGRTAPDGRKAPDGRTAPGGDTAAEGDTRRSGGPGRSRRRGGGLPGEAAAGLRLVRATPLLRLVVLWCTTVNLVVVMLYYEAVFTLQRGGHGGAALGAVLAASGAAGLIGALAAPGAAERFGASRIVPAVTWLLVPLAVLLATVTGAWAYGLLFALVCLVMPVASVLLQTGALGATAPALQARTGAVLATTTTGAAALAPVLAGLLTDRLTTGAPALACGAALALLAAHTTRRPVRGALAGRAG